MQDSADAPLTIARRVFFPFKHVTFLGSYYLIKDVEAYEFAIKNNNNKTPKYQVTVHDVVVRPTLRCNTVPSKAHWSHVYYLRAAWKSILSV